jgi:hypothetical protein
MVKFKCGDVTVFGLSEENIKRLKDNQPIRIDMAEIGGTGTTYIYYGKTEKDLAQWLEDVTGKSFIN